MKLQNFRLIAAPFTPMHGDGSLNLAIVREQAEHLIASGVRGVFVGGTAGEGQSLTLDERMSLTETWARDSQRSDLELFVHIGHNCQDDAIRLAHHARAVEADAIALHAPTWFKQQSLSELIEFCMPVALAAASLPFYLYDMPKITGVRLSSAEFLASAKRLIPTLAGVKYTNPDCVTVQECIQLDNGAYDILWGCDETLLAGIALGASGAVGSTYNFAAPVYLRILDAVESDDWQKARAEQARAVAMVRIFEQFNTPAALKFAMNIAGVDCGPVRAPLGNLTATDQRRLRSELDKIQFLSEIAVGDRLPKHTVISSTKSA
jgi:N-acetylneuraminate lyase